VRKAIVTRFMTFTCKAAIAYRALRVLGGADRVVSLTDRVWFKVKTSHHRAAATELRDDEVPGWIPASKGAW